MALTQPTREVAILPEMAGSSAPGVVVLRIPSVDPPEKDRQRIFVTRDHHQVDMIAHHAPPQQSHLCVVQIVSQQPQVGLMVLLCRESGAPVHATLGDVVRQTG
jgi:hypothetical protein